MTIYVGLVAVAVNLAVAALGTLALRAARVPEGPDGTRPDDYFADAGDPKADRRTGGEPPTDPVAEAYQEPAAKL